MMKAVARLKRFAPVVVFAASAGLSLAACGDNLQTKDYDAEGAGLEVKRGVAPVADQEAAVIETDFGQIVVELYPNIAPKTVERFKQLAREGFYNNTAIHRVEPFVIQGGDPNSKDDDPSDDGQGGSPYPNLPAEPSDLPFEPGTLGAADAGPGTANSQFYITMRPMPQWVGRYTAFGRVIKGFENARVISNAPTLPGRPTPAEKIVVKSVTLQPRQNFKSG